MNRWRNPEDDLPPDFEDNRDVHYDALRQPQDPHASYGRFELDMGSHLDLVAAVAALPSPRTSPEAESARSAAASSARSAS
ncbi:hypothetical protein A6A06_39545 [Streptomyces sp. CB02923]|uniref:hypothetical protein n=1 Tax=Streptomyces sp. CB02923 TaxID=1718985 RepID=UPI0009600BCD|nr:hypothetical protein [Streptomyces sp. CB02923]OKI03125.1 hypothetical protein A6A06_39545 [Streptomyces sp. CB02923]